MEKAFINIRVTDKYSLEYEPLKYLRLVKKLGIESDDTRLTSIVTTDSDKIHVDELLKNISQF